MDYKQFHNYQIKIKGLPTEDGYNQYFNPNVCHVCKLPDDGKLLPCDICGLISYCCYEHRILHEESHREVCIIIYMGTKIFELELDTHCNLEDWIKSRKQSITYIKQFMTRDLKPYEVEIIMCAKSCFYCHKRTDLQTCKICYSVNYCTDHEVKFIAQHKTCRTDLMVLMSINFLSMYRSMYLQYPAHKKISTFPTKKSCSNMITFFHEYLMMPSTYKVYVDVLEGYTYSDYMSNPLTLYYTYKNLNLYYSLKEANKFVVHILAANAVDVTGLKAWELFLHLCLHIEVLIVVMIKSEAYFDSYEYKDTCKKCREQRMCKLYFENVTVSYHDYVNTTSYKQPNVIIGSLPRLNSVGEWPESSKAILSQNCPILLTAKSRNQIEEMENILKSVIATFGVYFCGKNKYRGLRPYRDYETGGVLYHNYYVMMFSVLKVLASCD